MLQAIGWCGEAGGKEKMGFVEGEWASGAWSVCCACTIAAWEP